MVVTKSRNEERGTGNRKRESGNEFAEVIRIKIKMEDVNIETEKKYSTKRQALFEILVKKNLKTSF